MMRVPVSWLQEYVSPLPPVDELAEGLTNLGLKVDAVLRPQGKVEKVVVGEVLSIRSHPKADKLILVEVTIGSEVLNIVCGAHNFEIADRVPVALVGARLPTGLEVGRKTIRGEVSDGMLCSSYELGLSEDHTGILVLSRGTDVGKDVREVLGLEETVLDLDITPNRPDAMSLVGVAYEAAARFGSDLALPDVAVEAKGQPIESLAQVVVEDEAGCPRYTARVITGVSIGPSPDYVQKRLSAAGIRPISNVVDATNYALLVFGQPMHAFDLDKVRDRRIVVRRAKAGEKIETLDGEERVLSADDLVIADPSGPIGIAGVIGGAGSEISDSTKDVLIESAYFEPRGIFRTSKRHDVRTESSARFERGANVAGVDEASAYCSRLIAEWAGGTLAEGSIDTNPVIAEQRKISLRVSRANLVLGTDLSAAEMVDALSRLGLHPEERGDEIRASVGSRRGDIVIEEDLIEEIARLIGYEAIPSRLPSGSNRAGSLTADQIALRKVRKVLAGAGLWEAQTSSFIGPDDLAKLGWQSGPGEVLTIENPINAEASVLRPSLIPGLLAAVARNAARRSLEVRLFEIGRCFAPSNETLPKETLRLGIAMQGETTQEWHSPGRPLDFFDLKGTFETLAEHLRLDAIFDPDGEGFLHPGRRAAVGIGGSKVGFIGELVPDFGDRFEIPGRVLLGEFDLDALLLASRPPAAVLEVARFPAVLLDIAVSVAEEIQAADVLAIAREAGGELLESVRIFDVYRGEQIGEGRKSVALSLSFRHSERTLTEPEALEARDAIAGALAERVGARVRE